MWSKNGKWNSHTTWELQHKWIYKASLWRKKSKEVPLKSGNVITKELDRPQILGLQKFTNTLGGPHVQFRLIRGAKRKKKER